MLGVLEKFGVALVLLDRINVVGQQGRISVNQMQTDEYDVGTDQQSQQHEEAVIEKTLFHHKFAEGKQLLMQDRRVRVPRYTVRCAT